MNPLNLAPLPMKQDEETRHLRASQLEGFVEDSVVLALMADQATPRSVVNRQDLALSADDDDFAGWHFNPAPTPRVAASPDMEPELRIAARQPLFNRPLASPYEEMGMRDGEAGIQRWWIAGIAVAVTALLLTYLLLTLAHRPMPSPDDLVPIYDPVNQRVLNSPFSETEIPR